MLNQARIIYLYYIRIGIDTVNDNAFEKIHNPPVDCGLSRVKRNIKDAVEYRNKINELQTNYCFLGKVKGEPKEPSYDKEEIEDEFVPMWTSIDEAIKLLENDKPSTYDSAFIIKRDLTFLRKAKELKLKKYE